MHYEISPEQVQHTLGVSDEMIAWLSGVERPPNAPGPVLPDDAEAHALLERLGVAATDRAETLAARIDPQAHPELWWILDRAYYDMLAHMGQAEEAEGFGGWPEFPASTGALGMHLYIWLFLALVPAIRRHHAERDIPDDISWDGLTLLGRATNTYRAQMGVSGLGLWRQWGLPIRFRCADYQLGRLAFTRGKFSFFGRSDSHALSIHVPPFGAVEAAACDASFAHARELFPRHYPEEPITFFLCHSWLMDDQLAEYLPPSSNLIQFQRRFTLVREQHPSVSDAVILNYAFNRESDGPEISDADLDALPQDTTLQRAYVAHIRSGRHWYGRTGWFAF